MSLVAVAVFVIVPGNEVETVAKTLTVTGCAGRAACWLSGPRRYRTSIAGVALMHAST
jgi:hypothetical protein